MMLFQATQIVARQALVNAAEDLQWEDYPDIGEGDWKQVQRQALLLAQGQMSSSPIAQNKAEAMYDEAITMLEARAEGVEA